MGKARATGEWRGLSDCFRELVNSVVADQSLAGHGVLTEAVKPPLAQAPAADSQTYMSGIEAFLTATYSSSSSCLPSSSCGCT
jgi:hypothetical protein